MLKINHKPYLYYGLIISSLLFFSYFYTQGLQEIYNLQKEKEKIELNNQKLRDENNRLAKQIKKIKNNDREEIEKIVREELGLIKKGEIVYKFME
ncbi:MAG: FtsB family cell division protein [Thermodesulfobacteriota bacterium]